MDRPEVRQVPEGSGEQGKMKKTGCKIICGAPTTLSVKGLMMMMMMCWRASLSKASDQLGDFALNIYPVTLIDHATISVHITTESELTTFSPLNSLITVHHVYFMY